jgi:hypothetical protein
MSSDRGQKKPTPNFVAVPAWKQNETTPSKKRKVPRGVQMASQVRGKMRDLDRALTRCSNGIKSKTGQLGMKELIDDLSAFRSKIDALLAYLNYDPSAGNWRTTLNVCRPSGRHGPIRASTYPLHDA